MREEEQERKACEKEQKRKQKEEDSQRKKAKKKKSAASAGSSSSVITHRVETGQKRKSLHTEVPPPKKNCHKEGEEIDPNVCCMCFQNYNDDVVLVQTGFLMAL